MPGRAGLPLQASPSSHITWRQERCLMELAKMRSPWSKVDPSSNVSVSL